MPWQSFESFGSAGVSRHWPDTSNSQPWKAQRSPPCLQPAEGEIGAAMRAMAIDQAVAAVLVAKQHQVFAEQLDRPHRPRPLQLVDQRRRLPVHPHQLPAGVLRAGAGDQVVLFLAHHGGVVSGWSVRFVDGKRIIAVGTIKITRVRRIGAASAFTLHRSETPLPDAMTRAWSTFTRASIAALRLLQKFGDRAIAAMYAEHRMRGSAARTRRILSLRATASATRFHLTPLLTLLARSGARAR